MHDLQLLERVELCVERPDQGLDFARERGDEPVRQAEPLSFVRRGWHPAFDECPCVGRRPQERQRRETASEGRSIPPRDAGKQFELNGQRHRDGIVIQQAVQGRAVRLDGRRCASIQTDESTTITAAPIVFANLSGIELERVATQQLLEIVAASTPDDLA